MRRNSIRVVCNPYTNKMSYYFKNEIGEWSVLSSSSPLSRQYYTNTSINERAYKILEIIDETYNRKNKGVDILFEGTEDSHEHFVDIINKFFPYRDIKCVLGTTKIAVLGKKSVGKTTLIEGMENLKGFSYSKAQKQNYIQYTDECNHAEWYEVEGIDLGKENVEKAFQTVEKLSEEGLSAVVYCVSAITGRIEDVEKELISKIENSFTELKIMIVLTNCHKDEESIQKIIDDIERNTNQIKLTATLAKKYKTRKVDGEGNSEVDAFGLEAVSEYVFEGR